MTGPRSRLTRSARMRLVALMNGVVVGHIYQMGNGRLAFRYEDSWRRESNAYPLSLSMPLTATEHGDRAIRSYLWGLLPDNQDVLDWWARRYGVSSRRVVDLLANVGEDCAGAVQFAVPERADALLGAARIEDEGTSVAWLDDGALEHRLRDLRMNPAAGRAANDTGQFSLAGAQPKTALYQSASGKWGVPTGRMPTNRILKPPTLGLDDLAYNEHFCLLLARQLGFSAAVSSVQHFGDEVAIVLDRYDREQIGDRLVRVHQEDMCQAFGIQPTQKYESDGGPDAPAIADLLRQSSTDPERDFERFIDAVALSWLIAATDAHAKNYSILHAIGPQLRMAPLYDIITVLPYPQLNHARSKLAMSIGGERLIAEIDGTHWRTLAKQLGVTATPLLERVSALADGVAKAVDAVNSRAHPDERTAFLIGRLGAQVAEHAHSCASRL
jgi:serine/threonine-protein kinase HipA